MKAGKIVAAIALLAAGCGSQTATPDAAADQTASAPAATLCIAPVTREVALTATDAKDVLTAEVLGADCQQGVLVLALRKADGSLLWSHSVRAMDTWAFVPASDDTPVDPKKGMESFLTGVFKNLRLETTGQAPDWPEGAERPEDPTGLFHETPLPHEAYLFLRTKNVPMLCVQAEMGTSRCTSYDPESGDVANTFYASSS